MDRLTLAIVVLQCMVQDGKGSVMKVFSKITVVDILVVIAILMILSAIVLPQLAEKYGKVHHAQRGRAASITLTDS